MASLQLATNSEFKADAWGAFYTERKQSAYTADQQITTHPIELKVANTAEAFTNFDAITYGKGASVLKQLAVFVGEGNFRQGVAAYLNKYAYQNTRLSDFMDEVAKTAKQNLSGWSKEWLYQAGLNTIKVDYQCVGSGEQAKIKRFEIVQSAPEKNPVWRHQRVQVGLYDLTQDKITLNKILPVYYQAERTRIRAAEGLACPAFIYPNIADWGYVKIELDKQSRQTLVNHLHEFDPVLRKMLWQNLWDDVEDASLPLTDYVQFVQKNIAGETEWQQAANVLQKMQGAAYYFWLMSNAGQDHSTDLMSLESLGQQELARAQPASDYQKSSFDTYVALAHTTESLTRIRGFLFNQDLPQGFMLDQDRRWAILRRLNQFQFRDYRELTAVEQQRDKSDMGQQMAIVSEVIRPDMAVKERWLSELLAPVSQYKYATLRMVMRALFPATQLQLRNNFDARILQSLPDLQARNNERFLAVYADSLTSPHACSSESVKRLSEVHKQYAQLNPVLAKSLSINVLDEQRCVDMMQLMNKK
jgi:aminopeptidase N